MNVTKIDNSTNFKANLKTGFFKRVPKDLKGAFKIAKAGLNSKGNSKDKCIMRDIKKQEGGGFTFIPEIKVGGKTFKSSFREVLSGTTEDISQSIINIFNNRLS